MKPKENKRERRSFPVNQVRIPYRWAMYDKTIDPNKYYVCSYMRTLPVCSMVGWYKLPNAKKILRMVYGRRYKKYLFFIKGIDLQNSLGSILIKNGKILIEGDLNSISHIPFWTSFQILTSFRISDYVSEIINIEKKDKLKAEDEIVTRLRYLCYGEGKGKSIPKNFKVERSKLSQMAKAIQKRKEIMYISEEE